MKHIVKNKTNTSNSKNNTYSSKAVDVILVQPVQGVLEEEGLDVLAPLFVEVDAGGPSNLARGEVLIEAATEVVGIGRLDQVVGRAARQRPGRRWREQRRGGADQETFAAALSQNSPGLPRLSSYVCR